MTKRGNTVPQSCHIYHRIYLNEVKKQLQ